MNSLSLVLFTVVLIIALHTLPTSSKAVKSTATTTTASTPTTIVAAVVKVPEKPKVAKPAAKVSKKTKAAKKSKKPKQSPWKVPSADNKKLFNDYKAILRAKLTPRQNISATYQLEAAKYGSQTVDKTILHHFLIKLPDSKYAHAIIGTNKDTKKPIEVNENSASIRRTIYDNLAAAEA